MTPEYFTTEVTEDTEKKKIMVIVNSSFVIGNFRNGQFQITNYQLQIPFLRALCVLRGKFFLSWRLGGSIPS
jgi:hypothetical protein